MNKDRMEIEMEVAEANIQLNREMNKDYHMYIHQDVSSTYEANIKIQEEFYNENKQTNDVPTYINNETPAIKITGKD